MEITPLMQGIYYVITGIWPVLSIRSFEKISGPKTDKWLVKTIGLLIVAIGVQLLVYEESGKLLGILAALALGGSAVFYSLRGTISKVYLLESLAEAAIIAGWLLNI